MADIVANSQRIIVTPEARSVTVISGTAGPRGPVGPPGVVGGIGDLNDVDLTGLADNDLIVYNVTTGFWEPTNIDSVGTPDHNHDSAYVSFVDLTAHHAPTSVDHDDRYYTEAEVDALDDSHQAAAEATASAALTAHHAASSTDHDDRYYTEVESDGRHAPGETAEHSNYLKGSLAGAVIRPAGQGVELQNAFIGKIDNQLMGWHNSGGYTVSVTNTDPNVIGIGNVDDLIDPRKTGIWNYEIQRVGAGNGGDVTITIERGTAPDLEVHAHAYWAFFVAARQYYSSTNMQVRIEVQARADGSWHELLPFQGHNVPDQAIWFTDNTLIHNLSGAGTDYPPTGMRVTFRVPSGAGQLRQFISELGVYHVNEALGIHRWSDRADLNDHKASSDHDDRYVNVTGDTMTGALSLISPTLAAHATRKDYVDAADATLQTNIDNIQGNLDTHITDPTAAHAASAVSFDGSLLSPITQTWHPSTIDDVQESIVTILAEIDGRIEAGDVDAIINAINNWTGGDPTISNSNVFEAEVIVSSAIAANAIVASKIAANSIDATKIEAGSITGDRLDAATTITIGTGANKWEIIGGSTPETTSILSTGATWANTTGTYMDASGRFRLGDSLSFDGATLSLTGYATDTELTTGLDGKIDDGGAAADVNANTTTISGGKITANSIAADRINVSQLSAITADLGAITAGSINIGSGTSVINSDGSAVFTNVTVTGYATDTELTTGLSGKIDDGGAAADVNANITTINGGKITANSIAADRLNVTQLSAITADLGSITAGSINIGGGTSVINSDGSAVFTNVTITGYATDTELTTGLGGKIDTGAAAADVNANITTISGGKITAGTITGNELNATTSITIGTHATSKWVIDGTSSDTTSAIHTANATSYGDLDGVWLGADGRVSLKDRLTFDGSDLSITGNIQADTFALGNYSAFLAQGVSTYSGYPLDGLMSSNEYTANGWSTGLEWVGTGYDQYIAIAARHPTLGAGGFGIDGNITFIYGASLQISHSDNPIAANWMFADWSSNDVYASLRTTDHLASEYVLLADGNNTYISCGTGGSTNIRGPANSTSVDISLNSTGITIDGPTTATGGFTSTGTITYDGTSNITIYGDSTWGRFQPSASNMYVSAWIQGNPGFRAYTDGSVTAPAVSFRNDTDVGMYRPGTNTVEICGGGYRMYYGDRADGTRAFIPGVYNVTTTSTAFDYVKVTGIGGAVVRFTSSKRLKSDIEDMDRSRRRHITRNVRPRWWRSKASIDNPTHSFYGALAEEVAEIDPRIASWAVTPDCDCDIPEDLYGFDEVEVPDPDGAISSKPRKEKVGRFYPTREDVPFWYHSDDCIRPSGVAYEQFGLFALDEIKDVRSSIAKYILARRQLERQVKQQQAEIDELKVMVANLT